MYYPYLNIGADLPSCQAYSVQSYGHPQDPVNLAQGIVAEVFNQVGIYNGNKKPGLGQGLYHGLMVKARAFHNDFGDAI